MSELLVKPRITPSDHLVDKGYWSVVYDSKEVRNFLQSQGLKNQDSPKLAKELLAGLLPDIFGQVFVNGAVPKSGYPAHDGIMRDTCRAGVVVVYEHNQGWDHYKTDPVKDGLGGASFEVQLVGTEKLCVPSVFGLEQLVRLIFGDKFPEVVKADKRYNPENPSRHRFTVGTFGFAYNNYGQGMDESKPFLTMAPRDPRYEIISQAAELFLKVVEVIKACEPQLKEYAGLVQQKSVTEGRLPLCISTALNDLEIAVHGIELDASHTRYNLTSALSFVQENKDLILAYVSKRQGELTPQIGNGFEPIRENLVSYFTQPLYSTKKGE